MSPSRLCPFIHSLLNNVKCLRRNNWQLQRNQSNLTISEGKSARRRDFVNGNFKTHTEALQNKLHLMCRELAKLAERKWYGKSLKFHVSLSSSLALHNFCFSFFQTQLADDSRGIVRSSLARPSRAWRGKVVCTLEKISFHSLSTESRTNYK